MVTLSNLTVWPEIVTALGSIAGSGLSSLWGQSQSKSLMRYQAQLNQEAIDRQNQYNSPDAQMQRLKAAGLNPNLVYGTGVTGNQSDASKVGIANRDARLDAGIDKAVEVHLQQRALNQQISESRWRSIEAMSRTALNLTKNKFSRATFADSVKKVKADLDHTIQSIQESISRENQNVQKTHNLTIEANKLVEEVNYWHAHAEIEKDLRPQEIRAHIHQMQTSGDLNIENKAVAKSIAALNDAKLGEVAETIKWLASRTHGQELENQLVERMQSIGLQGLSPKDFFVFVKELLLLFLKGK